MNRSGSAKESGALTGMILFVQLAFVSAFPAYAHDQAIESELNQISKLIKAGRFAAAADRSTVILKKYRSCADAYFDRATCYLHLMRFQDAVKDCDSAIAIKRSDARYYGCRGYACMRMHKYGAGITDYQMVLKLEPGNREARENIKIARAQLKKDFKIPDSVSDTAGRQWYRRGLAAKESGETAASLEDFQQALKTIKNDPTLYFLTAKALLAFERFDEAIDCFNKGIELDPDNRSRRFADARYWLASAYANKKQYRQALAAFDQVLKFDPKNYDSIWRKADIYAVIGEKQKAIDLYDRVLELQPEQDGIGLKRADLLMEMNQPGKAISYYEQMVSRAPEDEVARERRGRAYLKLGQYEKAADDLTFAIDEDPDSAAALYLLRAEAYAKLGKSDLAAADRKRAATSRSKRIKKPL